jgi:hypothetical protein
VCERVEGGGKKWRKLDSMKSSGELGSTFIIAFYFEKNYLQHKPLLQNTPAKFLIHCKDGKRDCTLQCTYQF